MSTVAVERCQLAPGFSISRILTGMWQVADMERHGAALDPAEAAAAMLPYVEAGLSTFDMADHYGSAEVISGQFRRNYGTQKPVQLFTKWVPKPGQVTRAEVRQAVERALGRMQDTSLDLLQFHAWNYADPNWLDCLYWLQELKEEGLIRNLGLTNFDTAHLRIVLHSGIDIVSNQVCFSLIDQRPAHGMTELCAGHGIKLLCYGTVAGGFLTERWLNKPEPAWEKLETWSLMKYGRFIREAGGWAVLQELLQRLDKIAARHNVSLANVACRYILDQPGVGGLIIGARLGKSARIADNLRIFTLKLSDDDRAEIARSLQLLQPIPGNSGDEYRRPPFLTASGDLSHHLESIPVPYAVRQTVDGRSLVLSGTSWERIAGYCRAVRRGERIWVSGTTATHGERAIGGTDVAAQTHFAIDKIIGALQSLGAGLENVVRTRVFVKNIADWEVVARVHGERFRDILPANTLVQAALVGEEYLVEIEAEALVSG